MARSRNHLPRVLRLVGVQVVSTLSQIQAPPYFTWVTATDSDLSAFTLILVVHVPSPDP